MQSTEFLYDLEETKASIQNNLGSLLELQGFLMDRTARAKSSGKQGVFLDMAESEFITREIIRVVEELGAHYRLFSYQLLALDKRLTCTDEARERHRISRNNLLQLLK